MKKIKFQALLIAIFLFNVSLWTNAQECTNCQSSIVGGISASALGFGNQAIGAPAGGYVEAPDFPVDL